VPACGGFCVPKNGLPNRRLTRSLGPGCPEPRSLALRTNLSGVSPLRPYPPTPDVPTPPGFAPLRDLVP